MIRLLIVWWRRQGALRLNRLMMAPSRRMLDAFGDAGRCLRVVEAAGKRRIGLRRHRMERG